jgi:zinc protease
LRRLTTLGWNFATKKDNITLSAMLYTMYYKKLFAFFALASAFLLSASTDASAQRAPRQEKLLNGLKVLMWPDPAASNVELKLRIHAGSSFDPQGREGTMKMLAETMFPDQAARDFFAEDLGGTLAITTTYDYIQIDASSRPEHYLTMLEMIATAVSGPLIDRETTDKVRAMVLAEQKRHAADPGYVANMTAATRLLGTFPYGRPVLGTEETLSKVDFADIRFNYDRLFGADNATLVISGRFDANTGYRAVRRYFGNWLKSDETIPATFKQPEEPPTELMITESPSAERSEIRYAIRGVARGSKEFAAAEVLTGIYEARLKGNCPPGGRIMSSCGTRQDFCRG